MSREEISFRWDDSRGTFRVRRSRNMQARPTSRERERSRSPENRWDRFEYTWEYRHGERRGSENRGDRYEYMGEDRHDERRGSENRWENRHDGWVSWGRHENQSLDQEADVGEQVDQEADVGEEQVDQEVDVGEEDGGGNRDQEADIGEEDGGGNRDIRRRRAAGNGADGDKESGLYSWFLLRQFCDATQESERIEARIAELNRELSREFQRFLQQYQTNAQVRNQPSDPNIQTGNAGGGAGEGQSPQGMGC